MNLRDLSKFDPKLWVAQKKFDGHRAHPITDIETSLSVLSRHRKPLTVSQQIIEALKALKLPANTMLDSEWNARRASKIEELHIFDILWFNNEWIGDKPFEDRYAIIEQMDLKPPLYIAKVYEDFLELMKSIIGDQRTEGIVLKRRGFMIQRSLNEAKDISSMVKIKWRDGPDGQTQVISVGPDGELNEISK